MTKFFRNTHKVYYIVNQRISIFFIIHGQRGWFWG